MIIMQKKSAAIELQVHQGKSLDANWRDEAGWYV